MENKSVKSNRFHCPHDACIYGKGSERYFQFAKVLHQHIIKVHAEKKFLCGKCQKGFGSEWQQQYHSKTCGMEWKCSCGRKYNRRETLLTHHRRTEHPLASDVPQSKRLKTSSNTSDQLQRKIVPLQPKMMLLPVSQTIIYNIHGPANCSPQLLVPSEKIKSSPNVLSPNKLILPKTVAIHPACSVTTTDSTSLESNKSEQNGQSQIGKPCTSIEIQTEPIEMMIKNTVLNLPNKEVKQISSDVAKNIVKIVAETQTGEFPLESRTLPEKLRKNRRRSYRGTSIETQTVESIVGRMKSTLHSKSRISTKTMKKNSEAQSVWSCLNKLLTSTLSRNSSGTQTSLRGKVSHITSASQTLVQEGKGLSSKQTAHEMLGLLATVCQHLKDDSMSKEPEPNSLHEILLNKSDQLDPSTIDKVESLTTITSLLNNESDLTDRFTLEDSETNDISSSVPLLPTMERQTSTMNCSDYFSTNMETQTSEDTLLSDLELSHIQTQTPWDFLDNFCHDLNTNQLSADIQTDITGEDFSDIFVDTLWNAQMGSSLADVTDMETQTHGQLSNTELISACTQTLDDSQQLNLSVDSASVQLSL